MEQRRSGFGLRDDDGYRVMLNDGPTDGQAPRDPPRDARECRRHGATVLLWWRPDVGEDARVQLREVQGGQTVSRDGGAVDPRLVFGLGVTGTPLNLTVRWPGPTWRTQVIDDDAALEAAIGSMERPLVVVEPA